MFIKGRFSPHSTSCFSSLYSCSNTLSLNLNPWVLLCSDPSPAPHPPHVETGAAGCLFSLQAVGCLGISNLTHLNLSFFIRRWARAAGRACGVASFWGLNQLFHQKHLKQCLVHSKCSLHVRCSASLPTTYTPGTFFLHLQTTGNLQLIS